MNYSVKTIQNFEKDFKRLAKKYPSLKSDLLQLIHSLKTDPTQGFSLGNSCYKIRMAIKSKGKGKSGGSRVITYLKIQESTIYLLTIFDKSEQDNISDSELSSLLDSLV
jgi:mRNA-degrading endonuclease RelE of RelBE toxin-antitoxin system